MKNKAINKPKLHLTGKRNWIPENDQSRCAAYLDLVDPALSGCFEVQCMFKRKECSNGKLDL